MNYTGGCIPQTFFRKHVASGFASRWCSKLQLFAFKNVHVPGVSNTQINQIVLPSGNKRCAITPGSGNYKQSIKSPKHAMLNIFVSKTVLEDPAYPVFIWNRKSSTSKCNSYFEGWARAAPFFVYIITFAHVVPYPPRVYFYAKSQWGLIQNKRAQMQFSGKAVLWLC